MKTGSWIIIGVLLLQHVDSGKSGLAAPSTTVAPKTTTTTRPAESTTTTVTTVAAAPAKTPDQVKTIVLNGGAAAGSAGNMHNQLQRAGYTNQGQANDWSGHQQTGDTVMCKPGLTREATALAVAVGNGTPVKVVDYSSSLPSFATSYDCVVVVGA